jgi:hypothetical protein
MFPAVRIRAMYEWMVFCPRAYRISLSTMPDEFRDIAASPGSRATMCRGEGRRGFQGFRDGLPEALDSFRFGLGIDTVY